MLNRVRQISDTTSVTASAYFLTAPVSVAVWLLGKKLRTHVCIPISIRLSL